MDRVRFPIDGVTYHTVKDADAYRRSGSWIWSTLGDMLREAADAKPDATYIAADDGALTFADVDTQSESLAAALLEIGLKPGDRAIFQVGTVKEIVIALFGCFKASVVPVCTLPQYREIEIGQLARLSGAKAYFVQADFSPTFDLAGFARRMMREHPSLTALIVTRGQANPGEYDLLELANRYTREQARVADARCGSAARRRRAIPVVRRVDRRPEDHSAHACGLSGLEPVMECASWSGRRRRVAVGAAAHPQCRHVADAGARRCWAAQARDSSALRARSASCARSNTTASPIPAVSVRLRRASSNAPISKPTISRRCGSSSLLPALTRSSKRPGSRAIISTGSPKAC